MMSRRAWMITATAGALAVGTLALAPKALARGRVETPNYQVISTEPGFEVRRYDPRLVAEVSVSGTAREASNEGFRVLASFIFGNNSKRTEVAMTAPVGQTAAEPIAMTAPVDQTATDKGWVIAFTMPAKYTLETLPTPNDPRVQIRELPACDYAVVRFSGAPSAASVERKIAAFVAEVDAVGLERSGAAPIYARYDPPWTPGLLRRNEILVELRPSEGG